MTRDIYQEITNKIIADLEAGQLTWRKPWNAAHMDGRVTRPLRHTGEPYNGINVVMLWAQATTCGYTAPTWMTYRQAKDHGAQVRKGERGTTVVYANTLIKTEEGNGGETREKVIPFLKTYSVFNVAQIEGLPEGMYEPPAPVLNPMQRIDHAETFFAATGADIRTSGTRAFYSGADYIQMPPFQTFTTPQAYYATLAHETTHWTKHKTRLNRDFGRTRKGDAGYAKEELVAELGAAFLCADLGLRPESSKDHAAYIQTWLKVLKDDKRAIFTTAAHATRAAQYLHDLQQATPHSEAEADAGADIPKTKPQRAA